MLSEESLELIVQDHLAELEWVSGHGPDFAPGSGERPTKLRPFDKIPTFDKSQPLPRGSRDELLELGPKKWARAAGHAGNRCW